MIFEPVFVNSLIPGDFLLLGVVAIVDDLGGDGTDLISTSTDISEFVLPVSLPFLGVLKMNRICFAVVYGISRSWEALKSEILDLSIISRSLSFFSLERDGLAGSRKLLTMCEYLNVK